MYKPPIPPDEDKRLEDLRRLNILLTTPEQALDRVTQELTRIFGVPAAMISFIDSETQYYKSAIGLHPPFSETRTEPRKISICSYVVGTNEMLVVEDLSADHRFCENPAVRDAGARFYAGAPLRADSGRPVGSLCIVDRKPRSISKCERDLLELLATGVMAEVKLQVASRKLLDRALQMDQDLARAVRVQQFLLPPATIEGDGWRIEHLYKPVDRLCGDFLDVSRRPDGRLAILVADITGHGTSAALTTAMVKTAFLRAAPSAPSAATLLNTIHDELSGMTPPDKFITAVAALFDPTTMNIQLASAGHPSPLLIHGNEVEVICTSSDMALLVAPEADCQSCHAQTLGSGDRLLIYTDGAIEASNEKGAMLGMAGFLQMVHATRDSCGDAFLYGLFDRINAYAQNRLHDDLAMLTVTVR